MSRRLKEALGSKHNENSSKIRDDSKKYGKIGEIEDMLVEKGYDRADFQNWCQSKRDPNYYVWAKQLGLYGGKSRRRHRQNKSRRNRRSRRNRN